MTAHKGDEQQLTEEQWRYRLRLIYRLLQQVKKCREEIAKEEILYEDLLEAFCVEPFNSLRNLNTFADSIKPPVFRSSWKQLIRLALETLGIRADYKAVANWIADNHPNAQLPSYCNKFKHLGQDIGWLTANHRPVAVGVGRDVSRVRVKMKAQTNRLIWAG
jgi:hypothetical protein